MGGNIQALKDLIRKWPWLYSVLLFIYLFPRRLKIFSTKVFLTIKQKLYESKLWLRQKIVSRPVLLIYAMQFREIFRGNIHSALKVIKNQVLVDWHNWLVVSKNKKSLEKLYHEAIACCIKNKVNRWWTFLPDEKFDSITTLQAFLRECVLRRAGDFEEYISINKKLNSLINSSSEKEDFYLNLAEHYSSVIKQIDNGSFLGDITFNKDKTPFLIGFSVWGEHYLNLLVHYCLASLLTDGNMGVLCKERSPILLIHTNPDGKGYLEEASVIKGMKEMGVIIHYVMINENLINDVQSDLDQKYWHLGMAQSIDLYCAKALKADFHLLMPDTVYSNNHFKGILYARARNNKVITRLGLSVLMETICPSLEDFRGKDGSISINAADLASLSIRNVHEACVPWISTNKNLHTEAPNLYMIVLEGKDGIHMLSPHQTILFMDHEVTANLKKRFYVTLDGELDKVIPSNYNVYCPKKEDEIYLIEVTSQKQHRPVKKARNSIEEFCRLYWYSAQESHGYWKFFNEDIIDPINRNLLDDRSYMSDDEIFEAKKFLRAKVLESFPSTSIEQMNIGINILKKLRKSSLLHKIKGDMESALELVYGEAKNDDYKNNVIDKLGEHTHHDSISPIARLYKEAILSAIQNSVHRWWRFLPDTNLQSVPALQDFLRECVLRRAGDYREFLRIRSELRRISISFPPQEHFFDKMAEHYSSVVDEMDQGLLVKEIDLDSSKRIFLMGFSVWGEHYIHILINYCLPSLLTEGNLGVLCKERQPIMFIHTDEEGRKTLESSEIVQRVKKLGVVIIYKIVNEELTKYFLDYPDYKYWHLGMVQSLELYFAKTLNADYHILMPDSIYSESHFSGLLKAAENHKVIIRLMLSTRKEGVCPEIEAFRDENGVISVPAAELTSISIKNVHSASQAWIITNNDLETQLSNVHVVIWEAEDKLHMLSSHQTILYIDREVLRKVPKRFFVTLDSELDKLIPKDCPVYCPKLEDEICLIEMTSEKQRPMELAYTSIEEFCRRFWFSAQESMEYWRIFDEEIIDPLNRCRLSDREFMSEEEISLAKEKIQSKLLEKYPEQTEEEINMAIEILEKIKTHPDAENMLDIIDKNIEKIKAQKINTSNILSAA